jgi:hypothetical protein
LAKADGVLGEAEAASQPKIILLKLGVSLVPLNFAQERSVGLNLKACLKLLVSVRNLS